MQMRGEQAIAATRTKVWEALNDPAVLGQCIPGCQSLEKEGDDRFAAVAEVRIGPIGARFRGTVQLSDIDPGKGYTITGSGNGGIAGSAKGGAKVRLSDAAGGGTLVSYEVDAEVGGRMAQLGGPIIDATAKNLAGKFFAKFGEVVSGTAAAPTAENERTQASSPIAATVPQAPGASPFKPDLGTPAPMWGWVVALLAALTTGFLLGQRQASGETLVVAILLVLTAAAAFQAGRRRTGR